MGTTRRTEADAPTGTDVAEALHGELDRIDALASLAVRHVEDAASEDPVARRRYARLLGVLADYSEGARERGAELVVTLYRGQPSARRR